MSYKKAEQVLPKEMIELIQKYIDGEYIYIPRKENKRKSWGESTAIRSDLDHRNQMIYVKYLDGFQTHVLAKEFYLSEKSIQRIILQQKKKILCE
jgi:Mor family transcriptional regulator